MAPSFLDAPDDVLKIGPDTIHLVHEGNSRHVVLVRLTPDRLGLRLDSADSTEDRYRAVETLIERSTSTVKSTCGRINYIDIVMPHALAAEVMVIPRSRSWSM